MPSFIEGAAYEGGAAMLKSIEANNASLDNPLLDKIIGLDFNK